MRNRLIGTVDKISAVVVLRRYNAYVDFGPETSQRLGLAAVLLLSGLGLLAGIGTSSGPLGYWGYSVTAARYLASRDLRRRAAYRVCTWHFSRPLICVSSFSQGLVFCLSTAARLLHLCLRFLWNLCSRVVADRAFSPIGVGERYFSCLAEALVLGKCGWFSAPNGDCGQQSCDTFCFERRLTRL